MGFSGASRYWLVVLNTIDMKTYDEVITNKLPFDSSGIDLPQNHLWAKFSDIADVYYPKVRIVTDLNVQGYDDGHFMIEVNCISSINHDTAVADYEYFYCLWDSTNLEGDAFEWQWRSDHGDECPPYYEEVENYIEIAYIKNIIKAPTNQSDLHLKHMVELIEELQGTELIHLQEDMPQEYGKFVLAKQYVTKFLAMLLVAFTLVGCQRDVSMEMSDTEWQTLEVINDLEDAKEWLMWDMEEGRIDSIHGYSYLRVIDESIDNLQTLKIK